MGLRIRTNVESISAQRSLSNNQSDLNNSMERLTSGSRINRSSDDAAGLAISENLRAKTRGILQAKRNASDGVSLIQVAESGLNEMSNIMIRLRELTVQSASDTIGTVERGYLQKEYEQLVAESDRISKSTEFNGRKLFGEEMEQGLDIQVGYGPDELSTLKVKFGNGDKMDAEGMGLLGTNIVDGGHEEITKNLVTLDSALTMIASNRATLGAMSSRLNTTINGIAVNSENMMAANSRIRDTDFAEETAKMTQAKILSQSGLAVLAQANIKPEMALQLLRS
jgi:flagellin